MKKNLVAGFLIVAFMLGSITLNNEEVSAEEDEVLAVEIVTEPITVASSSISEDVKVVERKWDGYVTCSKLYIHKSPLISSEVTGYLGYNEKVTYSKVGNNIFYEVFKDGKVVGYVLSEFISNREDEGTSVSMPSHRNFKSYMPYTALSSTSSRQYALQKLASTGFGGIRVVNDRYCVAVGTAVGCEVGQYITLVQENGYKIECVVGDIKDDKHTESNNIVTSANGCVSEFIVDSSKLDATAKKLGSMNGLSEDWDSTVVEIIVWDYVIDL